MALRTALGAGRARLARQMLTESTVLSLAGGVLGVGMAFGTLDLLVSFAARFTPRASEIRIDGPVLLFALVVSLLTGLLFGLLPSLSARGNVVSALQEGGDRSTGGVARHRLRSALIAVQVAVSFMLLIGAGLMLRSLWKLARVDPGFRTERVLTTRLDLNFSKYRDVEPRRAFQKSLLERVSAQSGVVSAAIAGTFPLNDGGPQTGSYVIEGQPARARGPAAPGRFPAGLAPATSRRSGSRCSRDARSPIPTAKRRRSPRSSTTPWRSTSGGPRIPIGRRISIDDGKNWIAVVGVVGDVRQYGLDRRPTDQVYVATPQFPPLSATLLLRSSANPMALSRLVRDAVHGIDPEQAVDRFRTLEQVRSNSLSSPRLTSVLLVLFAVVALAITSAGIAGVVAFSVGERTQEFGIRLALGADPRQVVRMVLREAMGTVADRPRLRIPRRAPDRPRDVAAALRGERDGSADVSRDVAGARGRRRGRELPARAADHRGRSDDRPARRLDRKGGLHEDAAPPRTARTRPGPRLRRRARGAPGLRDGGHGADGPLHVRSRPRRRSPPPGNRFARPRTVPLRRPAGRPGPRRSGRHRLAPRRRRLRASAFRTGAEPGRHRGGASGARAARRENHGSAGAHRKNARPRLVDLLLRRHGGKHALSDERGRGRAASSSRDSG